MPTILQIVTAEDPRVTANATPYVCRVSESGTITLPAVGQIEAAGKTLAEIEAAVVNAYYPTYAVTRPSVFAKILEYKTAKLSITGAVQKPGIYSLRSDQMSLVALLMEAGGIVEDGAATIRIIHSSTTGESANANRQPPIPVGLGLSFVQLTPSGTTGLLTVKRDEKVVLVELLDVSSNIQRRALLEKLAMQEPAASTAQVERQLLLLAGQLAPAYNISASENPNELGILAQGTASPEQQIHTLSDEALEKLRDALSEVLKHEKSLSEQGIARLQEGENPDELGIVLPVKGLNIPFADVALDEGDTVIVEPLRVPVFSVIGLVNRPGNFPYPAQERYNLMQALAFAGGLDRDAEPRYATIYRLKADGTIASASFQVVNLAREIMDSSTSASRQWISHGLNIPVKPNDIVAVEHTQRTRTTVFLQRMFSIHVGAYVPVWR
jgi:protein involved in polysaccharide export with SLBB domain